MERALMVSVFRKGTSRAVVDRQLRELAGLIEAAGGTVAGSLTQAREDPEAGLGRGALDELRAAVDGNQATLVVFDQEMKPSALVMVQNALEPLARAVDRTQIILDIFARRAASREGRVQVELAQYRYLEPRLRGMRASSRLGGGIGTRGPGETYLEMDRRKIRRHIHDLTQELTSVERQRSERRQRRRRTQLPLVTLIGYTNVGKSTLYSRLTRRQHLAEDALFVTLDPTVRRVLVPGFGPVLLSDTVGFVDRLPHHLVAAFRSTLDEVRDADLIVEVISANPQFPVDASEQAAVIDAAKRELGVAGAARLRVYTQWDRVSPGMVPPPDADIWVSAVTGSNMPELWSALSDKLSRLYREELVRIPWSRAAAWSVIYRDFVVVQRHDRDDFADLVVRGSEQAFHGLYRAIEG